ncbi:MAG: hypothetical protein ACYDB7_02995 [Mycobacteriales bacterium]
MPFKVALTPEEDAELRRLVYLVQMGRPDDWVKARIAELRQHDRRDSVRDVRDEDLDLPFVPGPRSSEAAEGPASDGPAVPQQFRAH